MLPADHRLTRPEQFRRAVKAGRRSGARTLVTHLAVGDDAAAGRARIGFVVSKAVGPAVVRNKVKRRLRHAARARTALLPGGALLVVRAQPAAAAASYEELVADLDRCLDRSLRTPERRDAAGSGQVER
ncbi:ribonuclease P protein component [Nocardioides immobilis]|uniref:Ribonuclease P protein component n=1 Tax=Nocardioides immobilis TaxID=2049295 RepID=A0A417Y1A9_9ACTN|nr:ribonuclease P protein component [Nocardioides immobilis]RHW26385.1 ribonuclease P protein component [Nocardioides immobilis]